MWRTRPARSSSATRSRVHPSSGTTSRRRSPPVIPHCHGMGRRTRSRSAAGSGSATARRQAAPLTMWRKVEAGALDVDLLVQLPALAELFATYGINKSRLFAVPSGNIFYLHMSTSRPLFKNNVALRQAVNFALDRTQLLYDF